MMVTKILIKNSARVIIVFMLFVSNIYGQEFKKILPSFKGHIRIADGGRKVDSIYISAYNPQLLFTKWKVIRIKPDDHGNFSFRLPKYDRPSRILLRVSHSKGQITDLGAFFSEPDDEISIDLLSADNGCQINFSGQGAEKYNVAQKLKMLDADLSKLNGNSQLLDTLGLDRKFAAMDSVMKVKMGIKSKILSSAKVGAEMRKILMYQFGNLFYQWDYWLYAAYKRPIFSSSQQRKKLINYFNRMKSTYSYKADDLMGICPSFVIALTTRLQFEMMFNAQTEKVDLKEYYSKVDNLYSQEIKNQIFAWMFLRELGLTWIQGSDEDFDSLLEIIKDKVTLPLVKRELELKSKLSKGKMVFDGVFTGVDGKSVSIGSLRGKVVLLDIWGVGCSACAIFHGIFEKEVYPKINDRTDFVLLSVSNDHSREKWHQGMRSGKYTSDHYLNVYTDGQTVNHPFLKFYEINSFPFLLLIDRNGLVLSKVQVRSGEELLKLINDALSKASK